VAWNEIIAASNGYVFKNSGLNKYFSTYCGWYTPNASASAGGDLVSRSIADESFKLLKSMTSDWWKSGLKTS